MLLREGKDELNSLLIMKYKLLETDKYFTGAFWVVVFFMILLQVIPQTESFVESLLFSFLLISTIYFPVIYLSRNPLLRAMRTKKFSPFIYQFLFCSLVVGFIFAAYLYLFYNLEKRGIFPISYYFDLSTTPVYSILILFSSGIFINLCMCGVRFLLEYVKSQKIILEYQLRTLQHQVTPHFMFNVLNHVNVLMQSDVELASSLLIKYSEILRYQLYNGDKEHINLKDEVQFLKDFISVEELRWDDALQVTSEWKIEDEEIKMPSLLLITFVENAFKHVSKSGIEKGYIHINLEQVNRIVRFSIRNSKSVIEVKKQHGGLGLKNTKERLDILYHGKYDLFIEETDLMFHINLTLNL